MSCTFYYADMTVTYHFLTFNAATLPLKAIVDHITEVALYPVSQKVRIPGQNPTKHVMHH